MTNLSLDLKTIKTKNVENFYNYNNKGDKQLFEWNNDNAKLTIKLKNNIGLKLLRH